MTNVFQYVNYRYQCKTSTVIEETLRKHTMVFYIANLFLLSVTSFVNFFGVWTSLFECSDLVVWVINNIKIGCIVVIVIIE